MDDDTETGILLPHTISLDDDPTIDWDVVLRDFASVNAFPEEHDTCVGDLLASWIKSGVNAPRQHRTPE